MLITLTLPPLKSYEVNNTKSTNYPWVILKFFRIWKENVCNWRKAESVNTRKKINWKKCNFLTNLEGLEFLDKLHDVIALLLQKSQEKRKVSQHEQRWVSYHQKATIKYEVLLILVKLRLELKKRDLYIRFDVEGGLCSKVFKSWSQAMG